MNNTPMNSLLPELISMSAVRLSKIKLPVLGTENGTALLGKPAIHFRTGMIYLPVPRESKIFRIETENDRLVDPIHDAGWVFSLMANQERDIVFALSGDSKEVRTFKAGVESTRFSMMLEIYPEDAAFDSDRDLLMVLGTGNPPPDPEKTLDLYRFPECRHLGTVKVKGTPVALKYDDLEDEFSILSKEPPELNVMRPAAKLSLDKPLTVPENDPVAFEMCPSSKHVVVGTSSGKIILMEGGRSRMVAKFREPISELVFNPLLNHLYVTFERSRYMSILDMETMKERETVKCPSEISNIIFDQTHNKFYVFMEKKATIEVYMDQGR